MDRKTPYQRERERQASENERLRFAAEQAGKRDVVTVEEITLSASEAQTLIAGDLPRHRFGGVHQRKVEQGWTASDFASDDPDLVVIQPEDHYTMFGVQPPPPPRERTPEEALRAMEPTRLDKIRDAFKRLDGGS
jgi:hypothetical protein